MARHRHHLRKLQWLIWPLTVAVSFLLATIIVIASEYFGKFIGLPIATSTTSQLVLSVTVYVITILMILYMSKYVLNRVATRQELGVRILSWTDIGLAVAIFLIYAATATIALVVIQKVFPGFNGAQPQDLGFKSVYGFERMLAFFVLVIVAPVAEELIFRGYLYGKMRKSGLPVWAAIVITSILFGLAHGQLNVGIDVFVLSVFLCLAREYTGSISASILVHMAKNALAFYAMFVAPGLFNS